MAEHEKETVIVSDSGERGSGGTIAAVLVLLAVIALLLYLFGGNMFGGGETTDIKADVDIDAPVDGSGS